jgi:hypothetical protein
VTKLWWGIRKWKTQITNLVRTTRFWITNIG